MTVAVVRRSASVYRVWALSQIHSILMVGQGIDGITETVATVAAQFEQAWRDKKIPIRSCYRFRLGIESP